MVWSRGAAALLVVWLACAAGALAQKPSGKPPAKAPAKPVVEAPKLVPFVGGFDAAKASAKERNVPILVHLILEKEEASDRYRTAVLPEIALIRKSAECLVIVANNGTHPPKSVEEVVEGQRVKRDVCSAYPMFSSCSQHQKPFEELHREFHESDGQLRCPQTFVILPDGTLSMRVNNGGPPDPAEVVGAIGEAQTKCGPGLTEAQLAEVKVALEQGRNLTAAKSPAEAWKQWQRVLAITTKSVYAEEAAREAPKALAAMKAELDRIAAGLVPGTAVRAYQELAQYAKSVGGTPLEKEAATRLKKAEQEKSIAAELQAWRLSVEADQLLVEARDLYEQKQEKKGERVVRKLLAKRFASTPAAETARKLWPEVAAIVDAEGKGP